MEAVCWASSHTLVHLIFTIMQGIISALINKDTATLLWVKFVYLFIQWIVNEQLLWTRPHSKLVLGGRDC